MIYHGNKAKCSVLLFRPTQNKETLKKVGTCATSIIRTDLAKATGIDFSVGYESEIINSELNFSFSVNKMCKEDRCHILAGKCVNAVKKGAPSKQTRRTLLNSNKKNYRVAPSREKHQKPSLASG